MSNNLIIKDGSKIKNEFKELLDKSISREVIIDGNFYDMYTLDPPQSFPKEIKRLGNTKTEVKCEFSQNAVANFKYLQSIYKSYINFAIKNINIIYASNNDEDVKNMLKILNNNINDENFYNLLYENYLDIVITSNINRNNKTFENFNKNEYDNFIDPMTYIIDKILNKKTEYKENTKKVLLGIIICKLIINITTGVEFKMKLPNNIFTIIYAFRNDLSRQEYQVNKNNINLNNKIIEKMDIQYEKDKKRPLCSDQIVIDNLIDKGNKNLKNLINQFNSPFSIIIPDYIVYPLILLYNKNIFIKDCIYDNIHLCYINIIQKKICYYMENDLLSFVGYFKYCDIDRNMVYYISQNSNELESILDNELNRYLYLKCNFTKDLDNVNFTFENDVDISAKDKQILGEKYPFILEGEEGQVEQEKTETPYQPLPAFLVKANKKYDFDYILQNFKSENFKSENFSFPDDYLKEYGKFIIPNEYINNNKILSEIQSEIENIIIGGIFKYILTNDKYKYSKKTIDKQNNNNLQKDINNIIKNKEELNEIIKRILTGVLYTIKPGHFNNRSVIKFSTHQNNLKQYFKDLYDNKNFKNRFLGNYNKLVKLGCELYTTTYEIVNDIKHVLILCDDYEKCDKKKIDNIINFFNINEQNINEQNNLIKYYYIGNKNNTLKNKSNIYYCNKNINEIADCNYFPNKYNTIINYINNYEYNVDFYKNILKKLKKMGTYIYRNETGNYIYKKDDNKEINVQIDVLLPEDYFDIEVDTTQSNFKAKKLINHIPDDFVNELEKMEASEVLERKEQVIDNILILCATDVTYNNKRSKTDLEKLKKWDISKANYYYIGDELNVKDEKCCKDKLINIDNCTNFPKNYDIILSEICPISNESTIYNEGFYKNILTKLNNNGYYIYTTPNQFPLNYYYEKKNNEKISFNITDLFPEEYFNTIEGHLTDGGSEGIVQLKPNIDVNEMIDTITEKLEKRSVIITTANKRKAAREAAKAAREAAATERKDKREAARKDTRGGGRKATRINKTQWRRKR